MEDESIQKTDRAPMEANSNQPTEDEAREKHPNHGSRVGQKGVGWTLWLLVILMGLLLVSSVANLVVSQRAYESSRKQVKAIEQLTQSIKAVQRSIVDLSKMLEQSPLEDEEPEEDTGTVGDGSI